MQPVSRTAEIEEHRIKSLKFGGSVITERLYIDIKQDLKKKKINIHPIREKAFRYTSCGKLPHLTRI